MEKAATILNSSSLAELPVTTPAHANSAADAARDFARRAGFSTEECDEVALAVMELGSNLVRHAGGGLLRFNSLDDGERRGLEIISEDHGPGILNPEQAIADGFSTAGSLGAGLGAVNRLMDEVEFSSLSDGGLRIACHRWTRPGDLEAPALRLEFGGATRPYRFQPVNGDAIIVRQWNQHALAGVIDGLGHGQWAQRAAQAARYYLEQHFDQPLLNLFRGVGRVCRSTRGVVMALARFDLARQRVELASVGNVESRLLWGSGTFHPVGRRGIVGAPNAPSPLIAEHTWKPGFILVLHSDGIEASWQPEQLMKVAPQGAAAAARHLLFHHGRLDDDVTALVARNAPAPPGKEVHPTD
jgi:anti-sigma regulatory factor (Ser/Thr protein kinase)